MLQPRHNCQSRRIIVNRAGASNEIAEEMIATHLVRNLLGKVGWLRK
jgi:hypothetical protein